MNYNEIFSWIFFVLGVFIALAFLYYGYLASKYLYGDVDEDKRFIEWIKRLHEK